MRGYALEERSDKLIEFTPLNRKKGYLEITEQVRRLIEEGKLRPGARLPAERDLAQQLVTSRPTLREALAALEILGYIHVVSGRGIFVADHPVTADVAGFTLDATDSPFHLLEMRLIVEPEAAALAAERIEPDALDAVQTLSGRMKSFYETTGNFASDLDHEFHIEIARSTSNPLCLSFVQAIVQRMRHPLWSRLKGKTYERPGRATLYLKQHKDVADALARHDDAAAREAMKGHLQQVWDDLLSDF